MARPFLGEDDAAYVVGMWLEEVGAAISVEVDRLWPGEDDGGRAQCLSEEAGEVSRAITKRRHASRSKSGTCKGMTVEQWTEELRLELAQTVGVCLDIAHREGFDLAGDIEACLGALRARPVDS